MKDCVNWIVRLEEQRWAKWLWWDFIQQKKGCRKMRGGKDKIERWIGTVRTVKGLDPLDDKLRVRNVYHVYAIEASLCEIASKKKKRERKKKKTSKIWKNGKEFSLCMPFIVFSTNAYIQIQQQQRSSSQILFFSFHIFPHWSNARYVVKFLFLGNFFGEN